nr:probable glutamate receptor [Penaeus vannamei]
MISVGKDTQKPLPFPLAHSYTCHEVRDGQWDAVTQGEWSGLVGEVARGEADNAIASLTISQQRSTVVDFLVSVAVSGYFTDRASFVLAKGSPLAPLFNNVILDLGSSGLLSKFWLEVKVTTNDCGALETASLEFLTVVTSFLVLVVGAVVSFGLLGAEWLLSRRIWGRSWGIYQDIGNTYRDEYVWARSLEPSEGRAEWPNDLASVAGNGRPKWPPREESIIRQCVRLISGSQTRASTVRLTHTSGGGGGDSGRLCFLVGMFISGVTSPASLSTAPAGDVSVISLAGARQQL